MVEIKDLLPIGSIVLLKNAEKRLMITGVMQQQADNADNEFDYSGILYPEGNMGQDMNFLFNAEDIDTVFFYGFADAERVDFIQRLSDFYKNLKESTLSDQEKTEE